MQQTIEQLERKHAEEISNIRHDVNQMRQELHNTIILLNEANAKRDALEKNVERLIRLLEGDPIDPKRGLVSRIILMEDFINSMKNLRSYLMGNIAAVIFVIGCVGGIIAGIYKMYELFIKK